MRILSFLLLMPSLILTVANRADAMRFADGPGDNQPNNVRPVPPPGIELGPEKTKEFQGKIADVRAALSTFSRLNDADVCAVEGLTRAVEMTIEHNMFYSPAEVAMGDKVLSLAMERIELLRKGKRGLELLGVIEGAPKVQWIVTGHRSKIDRSIQPMGLVLPENWTASKKRRLDVWLHGRDEKTSEVGFLHRRMTQSGEFTPPDTIVLHPYGRYSNAFKFAGEIDVLEAIDATMQLTMIDPDRIAIRGFSMGGAGCWQMAVHYPDRWFAATPGAGFCETTQFLSVFQKEEFLPTPEQKKLLHWYDCPDWSNNLRYLPTIAYSGELDRQKQAADVMEASMKSKGLTLVHLIGPKTEHKFHPDSKKEIEEHLSKHAKEGRDRLPNKIDFTTYTLRYPSHSWISIDRLGKHWEEARVQASCTSDGFEIKTQNIDALTLRFPTDPNSAIARRDRLSLDGTDLKIRWTSSNANIVASFQKAGTQWKWIESPSSEALAKKPGLQGPIDDAFMSPFLFVPPNATSSQTLSDRWIADEYRHATKEWRRHFRGDIRSKPADEVSGEDIASCNLILFGTPKTNPLMAKIASSLPVKWSDEQVQLGAQTFESKDHVASMIYPNPLNPNRYVVLNSGFTFREYAYLNNARQIPMLPDWAIFQVNDQATTQLPGVLKGAGFFDERWKFQP